MAMKKTEKFYNETINILDKLKSEYEIEFPDTGITYDFVVNRLAYEHNFVNSPDKKAEEKRKLLKDYIPLDEFNNVYNRMRELETKFNQLTDEHNNIVKELELKIEKLKENSRIEKENYQKQIDDLNQELIKKKEELKLSKQKINELKEETMNQKINLERLQKEFNECKSDYNSLKEFVDMECFGLESLLTMYHIARFLSNPFHRKKMYTISQLNNTIEVLSYKEIELALSLTNYKIFPVRHYHQEGKEYFYFDRKYLR